MSWEPSQHLLIDTRKPRKRSSRSDHFTPGEEILCFPLNRLDGPPKRSVLRTCEDRISAVQYGSGAVSTKVYGNSEVVFDISWNGKLTLHVAGNVAAYKVSHPTPPPQTDSECSSTLLLYVATTSRTFWAEFRADGCVNVNRTAVVRSPAVDCSTGLDQL